MAETPPLRRFEIPSLRRVVFQAHYSILGPEKAERIRESGRSWPDGGLSSPRWLADYELHLNATPGKRVIAAWDSEKNVKRMPMPETGEHVLSFDFGATTSSYMTCSATVLGPKYNYTYWEYVATGLAVTPHKRRMRESLRQARPELDANFDWQALYTAIGDVTGVGYKLEYAEQPYPIRISKPSNDTGWRDRDESETILNGYLDEGKRCCYRQYDFDEKECVVCKQPLSFARGWYLDPRCEILQLQIPAQVVDEQGKRKEDGRDAFDTLMYAARYSRTHQGVAAEEAEKDVHPWWLTKERTSAPAHLERWVNGKSLTDTMEEDILRFL